MWIYFSMCSIDHTKYKHIDTLEMKQKNIRRGNMGPAREEKEVKFDK